MSETAARPYGWIGAFDDAEVLLNAVRTLRTQGVDGIEAYSPFPVDGLFDALGGKPTRLPVVALAGGIAGFLLSYALQVSTNAIDYPLNVGGRPLVAGPAFLIIAVATGLLFAALSSVGVMLMRNGLPRLHHPVFNVPEFKLASRDRFFLCIRCSDDMDRERAEELLRSHSPLQVWEVPQ